jgi:hypothetical protein
MNGGQRSGRKQGDSGVAYASLRLMLLSGGAVGATLFVAALACGQQPQGEGNGQHAGPRPVYQRHAFEWMHEDHDRRRDDFRSVPRTPPQISAGWFQRPYPYHLDYYRMRYGGSYAPYFGNLYGTPQVVYGGWGAGGWGAEYGGYPPPGVDGAAGNQVAYPPGTAVTAPIPNEGPSNQPAAQQQNESLPTPVK